MDDINNILQAVPDQNEICFTVKDVSEFKFDKTDLICLFIQTIINLKTEANYIHEIKRCENLGIEFDKTKVHVGKIEPHAFMLIVCLKLFKDWYTKTYDNELAKFVDSYLTKKRNELFFGEFNVQLESRDIYEINQIIDALTVKFYQEVIYAITTFFATQQKIIIIKPNGAMDGYLFKFRYMNILEKDKFKKGKLPVNATE